MNAVDFTSPKGSITMAHIAMIRRWVEPMLGASVMYMERKDGKTRAALRFVVENGISEADIAALLAVRRLRLQGAALKEQLLHTCRALNEVHS